MASGMGLRMRLDGRGDSGQVGYSKSLYTNGFHVNFDCAWVEHYTVHTRITLIFVVT